MAERFRIAPGIVHEAVDGEVIAIDLDNGSYFSLAGSGPAIWALLAEGASEEELRDALLAHFGDAETIATDLATLLERLRENGLVVGSEEAGSGAVPAIAADGNVAYEPPRFERYTDMKDYFLLDPIHEVDATGWPRPAA